MIDQKWEEKFRNSTELVNKSAGVLTGFNANIDVINQFSEIDLDLEEVKPELFENISTKEELKSSLKYCIENAENNEVNKGEIDFDLEGEEFIGGQAGIMSNFLAGTGNGVIFYTPLLSEELSSEIDEKVLYPVIDGEFTLKNVRDSPNTDRTKKNHIFEFNNDECSGRLILSDTLKGFGPYFRKGVEENLDTIEKNIECAIFSGFHDIEGNKDAKLKKSAKQLEMLDKPVHLEFVNKNREITSQILKYILTRVNSLGLDEAEFESLIELLDIENSQEKLNLGKAFDASKRMIKKFGLERIHLHTYRYHLVVAEKDYVTSKRKIRDSMLYGEVAAIQAADTGHIPSKEDISKFDMENKEINGVKELHHFGDFFDLEEFKEEGIADIDGYKVIAIPTVIHNDPKRTVGMGDIISSGAFTSEFS